MADSAAAKTQLLNPFVRYLFVYINLYTEPCITSPHFWHRVGVDPQDFSNCLTNLFENFCIIVLNGETIKSDPNRNWRYIRRFSFKIGLPWPNGYEVFP